MRRRAFTAVVGSAFLLPAPALAVDARSTFHSAGVDFVTPRGWITEDDSDGRALFMYAMPEPQAVEASMLIELVESESKVALDELISAAASRFSGSRIAYRELERSQRQTSAALRYGYLHFESLRSSAWFRGQYFVFPISDTLRFNIFASFSSNATHQYQPAVDAFVASLRVAA